MQFFLFLNDLAGRSPLFDEGARFFYVGAVPLLAALFLAELLLLCPLDNAAKTRRALAVLLSLALLAVVGMGIEELARAWHLGTLSPRPFMTRRVNLLVVEPQDNSFPCYEVAVAAILAVAMGFSHRKWGIAGAILTVLLALDRLFCGNNFLADVAFGALLGASISAMFCAFCLAPHAFERAAIKQWASAGALLIFSLGASYVSFAQTPRFAAKLPLFWSSTAAARSASNARDATRAARAGIGEGEGFSEATSGEMTVARSAELGAGAASESGAATSEPSAEELALSKRSTLFLPAVEKFLRGKLAPRAAPFRLLDVEVAPVRAGNSTYRCAALRFEIGRNTPDLRRRTAQVAATLVKLAFQSDSQLQNVDVTAILRGDGAQIDGTSLRFAGDEVPVFTASIQRQNLQVAAPRWANDPKLDGGLWLRTRSRLYINDKILPAAPPVETPTATASATPLPPAPLTIKPQIPSPKPTAFAPQAVATKPLFIAPPPVKIAPKNTANAAKKRIFAPRFRAAPRAPQRSLEARPAVR